MTRLVRLGVAYIASRPSVAEELLHWLRLSPEHPNYHRDGMTDRMVMIPRPLATLATPFTRRPRRRDPAIAIGGAFARAVEGIERTVRLPPVTAGSGPRHSRSSSTPASSAATCRARPRRWTAVSAPPRRPCSKRPPVGTALAARAHPRRRRLAALRDDRLAACARPAPAGVSDCADRRWRSPCSPSGGRWTRCRSHRASPMWDEPRPAAGHRESTPGARRHPHHPYRVAHAPARLGDEGPRSMHISTMTAKDIADNQTMRNLPRFVQSWVFGARHRGSTPATSASTGLAARCGRVYRPSRASAPSPPR